MYFFCNLRANLLKTKESYIIRKQHKNQQISEQERQCSYNVTMRRVHENIFALEKQ